MTGRRAGSSRGFGFQFATYAVASVVQRGLPYLILPFVTRILGAEAFGEAAVAITTGTVLSYLFTMGLNMAIVRTYFDEPAPGGRPRWAAQLRFQAVTAAVLAGVAWLTGPQWARLFSEIEWGASLQFAVLYALPLSIQVTAQGVLRAAQRPAAFTGVALVQATVGAVLGIWLAATAGAPGYVAGLALGSLVAAGVAAWLTFERATMEWAPLLAALGLALPFLVHRLSTWVLSLADRVILESMLGLEAVARYHVAYLVAAAPAVLFDAVQASWAPRYHARRDAAKLALPAALPYPATTVALLVAAATALVAPALLRILAPTAFGYSPLVVGLVSATAAVQATYFVGVVVLLDHKASRRVGVASGTAAALNIALNLLLIPRFGLAGAALATLLAFSAQAVLVGLGASRMLPAPLPIGRLAAVWLGTVAVTLGAAKLPTDGLGWALRGLGLVACGLVAVPAGRWLRDRYQANAETGPAAEGAAADREPDGEAGG